MTSFFGGLHGANVPLPILIKVEIVITITNNPVQINKRPISNDGNDFTDISLSIYIGTKTKTVIGRIKETS
jgi:hypothetical protein